MGNFFTLFASGQCKDTTFLGLEPWYHYIKLNSSCQFDSSYPFHLLGTHSDILLILLAVVDDLFRIVGLLAVIFVIYAGIRYITSQGSPTETAAALSTLIHALIGLAIAVVAIALVSFIGNTFTNGTTPGVTAAGLDLSSLPNPAGAASGNIVATLLSVAFGIIGALSFLFIVIGGLRYIYSNGDPKNAAAAQGTIIYALVGLIVAIVAESIVSLVIGKL